MPISNIQYLKFLQESKLDPTLVPSTWLPSRDAVDGYQVRVLSLPGSVPMEVAAHWPIQASGRQLAGYAKWRGGRLPTEPELRRFLIDHPVDKPGANIGFANWHPVP